jgi:hypothetical protein
VPGNPRPSFRRFVIRQKTSRAIASRRPQMRGGRRREGLDPEKTKKSRQEMGTDRRFVTRDERNRASDAILVRSFVRLTRPSHASVSFQQRRHRLRLRLHLVSPPLARRAVRFDSFTFYFRVRDARSSTGRERDDARLLLTRRASARCVSRDAECDARSLPVRGTSRASVRAASRRAFRRRVRRGNDA